MLPRANWWPSNKPDQAWRLAGRFALAATLIALGSTLTSARSDSSKATEELPPGAMQQKATTACTECHEARIIVQQRLGKAAWTREVDKMIKWGALVDAEDHDALIDYLSTNFSPDRPPYDPPRTAPEKNVKTRSGK